MDKVAILTLYYKNYNYGGQLQSYALQKTVSSLGYDCKQISFIRNRKDVFWRKIRAIIRSSPIEKRKFIQSLITRKKISQQEENKATKEAFDEWMRSIPHTEPIGRKDVALLNKRFDCFIVGSDQVWNTEFVPMSFFLDFVDDRIKKISYAASIRIKKYEKLEGRKIKLLLNRFDYISVREQEAVNVLRDIGVKKDIDVNIDPTMLLDQNEWNKVANPIDVGCKYIFTYLIRNEIALSQIKEYALRNHCKVISLDSGGTQFINDDVFVKIDCGVGPSEFVGLLKNAEYVFVESFHGTAFSIIFKKKFLVYGELDKDDRKKTVLETFGLLDRCINYETGFDKFTFPELETSISDKLIELRKTSLMRLKANLRGINIMNRDAFFKSEDEELLYDDI